MNPGIDVSTTMDICVLDKLQKYPYLSIAMMTKQIADNPIDFGSAQCKTTRNHWGGSGAVRGLQIVFSC
jgi:hypothetical protein